MQADEERKKQRKLAQEKARIEAMDAEVHLRAHVCTNAHTRTLG